MICILRLALTDDGNKWLPGTVLSAHTLNERDKKILVGDMVTFMPITAESTKYSFEEIRDTWRLKKAVILTTFLSALDLQARYAVKDNSRIVMTKEGAVTLEVDGNIVAPDWNTVINLDLPGRVVDTPKAQWPTEQLDIDFGGVI